MARARNIKPSFFTNEILGTLDPIIGMTFVGLWCLADKTGRLEDRPLRIKAELFPYRDGTDVNGYLTVLERNGFVERYEVDGVKLIQVVNFEKHQSPHHTEKPKGYPPKPKHSKAHKDLTVKSPCINGESQVLTRSDSLIPDSLIPDSTEAKASVVASKETGDPFPQCPQSEIIEAYKRLLPDLPHPRVWDGNRANNLRARWRWVVGDLKAKGKPHTEEAGLAWFGRFFGYVAKSDFLCGRTDRWKGADLGWLVKAENFAKVMEGNYHTEEVAA